MIYYVLPYLVNLQEIFLNTSMRFASWKLKNKHRECDLTVDSHCWLLYRKIWYVLMGHCFNDWKFQIRLISKTRKSPCLELFYTLTCLAFRMFVEQLSSTAFRVLCAYRNRGMLLLLSFAGFAIGEWWLVSNTFIFVDIN